MSDKKLDDQIKAIRKLKKEVCSSKASARKFLIKVGIVTEDGKLADVYK